MSHKDILFDNLVKYLINLCAQTRVSHSLAKKTGDDRKAFLKHCKDEYGFDDKFIRLIESISPQDREMMLCTTTAISMILSGDKEIYAEITKLYPTYTKWWDKYQKEQELSIANTH